MKSGKCWRKKCFRKKLIAPISRYCISSYKCSGIFKPKQLVMLYQCFCETTSLLLWYYVTAFWKKGKPGKWGTLDTLKLLGAMNICQITNDWISDLSNLNFLPNLLFINSPFLPNSRFVKSQFLLNLLLT